MSLELPLCAALSVKDLKKKTVKPATFQSFEKLLLYSTCKFLSSLCFKIKGVIVEQYIKNCL